MFASVLNISSLKEKRCIFHGADSFHVFKSHSEKRDKGRVLPSLSFHAPLLPESGGTVTSYLSFDPLCLLFHKELFPLKSCVKISPSFLRLLLLGIWGHQQEKQLRTLKTFLYSCSSSSMCGDISIAAILKVSLEATHKC